MFLQLGQVRHRHNNILAFVASSFITPCEVTWSVGVVLVELTLDYLLDLCNDDVI